MAKIGTVSVGGYLLPEGKTEFKITKVDDSKYDDFGKLKVEMTTQDGQKHTEQFGFVNSKGNSNEGAIKAWSFWVGTILGVWGEQTIDTNDLVGHYFEADVTIEESDTISEKTGEPFKNNRLNNMKAIDGFSSGEDPEEVDEDDPEDSDEETEDDDDWLDD